MEREYDKIEAMSNSKLRYFKRSPEHYIQYLKEGPPPSTPAMNFGTAFHTYVLEPAKFDLEIAVLDESKKPVPDKDYRTTANAEWKREFFANNADKCIISPGEFECIKRMNDKLRAHELAGELLSMSNNIYEDPITWNWKRTRCKGLKDITNPHFLADLKTTENADPDEWKRSFFKYDLYRQAGMYLDGEMQGKYDFQKKLKDFYFIAIEKSPPFGIAVYKPRLEVIQKGIEEYRYLCEQFQSCIDNKIWEGYEFKAIGGHLFEIELPYYMRD